VEQQYFITIAEIFLQQRFSLQEAINYFGELRHTTRWRYWFSLSAQSNLEDVFLEHQDGCISGLRLALKEPVEVDLSALVLTLGECEELQRLSPFAEVPFRFTVKGDGFDGTLIFFAYEVTLPRLMVSRFAIYRSYPPQFEVPLLTEEQLLQLAALCITPHFSLEQTATLFQVELPTQTTLLPQQMNVQRVELEISPANEMEGLWVQLETPSSLSLPRLVERFGPGEWNTTEETFGPTYDLKMIRRGSWVARLSLQCKEASDSICVVESFLLRRYTEESLGFPFWDTQESIVRLVDLFLDSSYNEDFLPEFFLGEVKEETPLTVLLEPPHRSNLLEVYLEKAVAPEGFVYLSGVVLRVKKPLEIDWGWLEKTLGRAEKVTPWKLSKHRFYQVVCQGSKNLGTLWLGVSAGLDGYWLENLALRREPPR
jgi:hypothetical protein